MFKVGRRLAERTLIARLNEIADRPGDEERDHSDADYLLLRFIDSPEVTAAYERIEKWYA